MVAGFQPIVKGRAEQDAIDDHGGDARGAELPSRGTAIEPRQQERSASDEKHGRLRQCRDAEDGGDDDGTSSGPILEPTFGRHCCRRSRQNHCRIHPGLQAVHQKERVDRGKRDRRNTKLATPTHPRPHKHHGGDGKNDRRCAQEQDVLALAERVSGEIVQWSVRVDPGAERQNPAEVLAGVGTRIKLVGDGPGGDCSE